MTISTAPTPLHETLLRCRQRQQEWARRPLHERLQPVRQLRRLLVEECERICAAVGRDLGKPADEALAADVLPLADACQFLLKQAKRLLRPHRISVRQRPIWLFGQRDVIYRRPRGLVGLIGTWNYPIMLNGVAHIQALTAGNAVVWKPSEVAPASADILHDLLRRAGYPEELIPRMPATREAGKELSEADIDFVSFTGSSTTGRQLAVTLAQRLIPSTLELSGCDALFVLEDADPLFAAKAAWFGMTINRGQTCIAARRAFVHRRHYESFTNALKNYLSSASPMQLALTRQVEQAKQLVEAAIADGGQRLEGNSQGKGSGHSENVIEPQIVIEARPEMALCQEASFAPVLAVLPFETPEEALNMEAQCPYALAASLFTGNSSQAEQWAVRLRAGMVTVNDVVVPTAHPATPFGGRGESGWGVTQGAEGLLEMTVPQVVSVRGGTYRPHYDLATTANGSQAEMARGLLEMGHGLSLGQRWRGLRRLLSATFKRPDAEPEPPN